MVFESFKDIQIIQVHCLESQFINRVVFLLWIMKLKRNNCYCFVFSISWISTKTTYFFSANFWHIIPPYLSKQIKKKTNSAQSNQSKSLLIRNTWFIYTFFQFVLKQTSFRAYVTRGEIWNPYHVDSAWSAKKWAINPMLCQ